MTATNFGALIMEIKDWAAVYGLRVISYQRAEHSSLYRFLLKGDKVGCTLDLDIPDTLDTSTFARVVINARQMIAAQYDAFYRTQEAPNDRD